MARSEVLDEIKKHLEIRFDKEFASFLGIKPTTLAMWHKRNVYDIELIFKKCDFLNPSWLITGKGHMILKPYDNQTTNHKNDPFRENSEIYSSNKLYIPLISNELFAKLNSNKLNIEDNDVIATYKVPEFNDIDFLLNIQGTTNYPEFNNGNIIACKIIHELNFIQPDKIHVIATKNQGVFIKKIQTSKNNDSIVAISDNNYSFEIPKNEILNIALIIGVIKTL